MFNPVVYLTSGFRWSFFEVSDVSVELSLAIVLVFLCACLLIVWWMFKTGYRLKQYASSAKIQAVRYTS